ncbi:hypothetical protein [Pseudanabaena sp. UWO310]|uniref:hypothetical protein n=1 Tax=Pseudanabaena sp. UWO310 TaxID=2480795 RepID=UPI00168075DC|nr:hypothetical protein [Pseudanabaena sp. UWO310]
MKILTFSNPNRLNLKIKSRSLKSLHQTAIALQTPIAPQTPIAYFSPYQTVIVHMLR